MRYGMRPARRNPNRRKSLRSPSRGPRPTRSSNVPYRGNSNSTLTTIGLLLSAPFIVDVVLLGHEYHHMHLMQMLMMMGLIVGAPMAIIGMMGATPKSMVQSSIETDIARIRFAAEFDANAKTTNVKGPNSGT